MFDPCELSATEAEAKASSERRRMAARIIVVENCCWLSTFARSAFYEKQKVQSVAIVHHWIVVCVDGGESGGVLEWFWACRDVQTPGITTHSQKKRRRVENHPRCTKKPLPHVRDST